MEVEVEVEDRLKRENVSYENRCNVFKNKEQYFENQYDEVYKSRLNVLQEVIKSQLSEDELGKLARVSELAPGKPQQGANSNASAETDSKQQQQQQQQASAVERVVIGTLYKELPSMPNLLKEYAAAKVISGFRWADDKKYTSEKDVLWVEDMTGRIRLNAAPELVGKYVTGVVAAVQGVFAPPNEFLVSKITPCGIPPKHMPVSTPPESQEVKKYVMLVSGINAGDPSGKPICAELLGDWIAGRIGNEADKKLAAAVVHIIIAGNSIYSKKESEEESGEDAFIMQAQKRVVESILPRTAELEAVLSSMAAACRVDLMPGAGDPANSSFPQQPMKRFLFPTVGQLGSLGLTTNPYCAVIGGKSFLGTSGQNIDNVLRTSTLPSRVAALRATLEFGHVAPTAPDTLECFPAALSAGDPMTIRECPNVYFAGNQPTFETDVITAKDGIQTRLIAVPTFSTTHTVVLVDLDTLEPQTLSFDA